MSLLSRNPACPAGPYAIPPSRSREGNANSPIADWLAGPQSGREHSRRGMSLVLPESGSRPSRCRIVHVTVNVPYPGTESWFTESRRYVQPFGKILNASGTLSCGGNAGLERPAPLLLEQIQRLSQALSGFG